MKNTKKMLNIAGTICLFVGLLGIGSLMLDLFYNDFNVFNIVVDSVSIVLSFATGITYLVLAPKDASYLIKNRNLFFVIVAFNIFNNIIAWFVSFWVELTISQMSRVEKLSDLFEKPQQKPNSTDENVVILDKSEYEVQDIVDNLKTELEKLEKLKAQGLITEEEYQVMRKEIIDKCFN